MKKILLSLTIIPSLLVNTVACSKNSNNERTPNLPHQWLNQQENYFKMIPNEFGKQNRVLSDQFYNYLRIDKKEEFNEDSQVEVVLIANKNIYSEIIDINTSKTMNDILARTYSFEIKMQNLGLILGNWLSSFRLRDEQGNYSAWLHGQGTAQNYNDYYPLIWINQTFAPFGVSNQTISPGNIYQITYDIEL